VGKGDRTEGARELQREGANHSQVNCGRTGQKGVRQDQQADQEGQMLTEESKQQDYGNALGRKTDI
jgi:hypothetical protein